MTNSEFSTQFDVWYNNITSNQAPGLNEYEKSVFLTKAEKMLVREYFNRRTDATEGGFDGSPKRQYDFSEIVKTEKLDAFDITDSTSAQRLHTKSKLFLFPEDYFLSVNEVINDSVRQYSVLPIDFMEYQRLMLKPYAYPPKRAAWRVITNTKYGNRPLAEIIGKFTGDIDYVMRYVKVIPPIILENLSSYGDDVTIDGDSDFAECILPSECHDEILERAVLLAKLAWSGNYSGQSSNDKSKE